MKEDNKITVGHIVDRYLETRRIEGKASYERMQHNWTALRPMFEHLEPSDVSAEYMVRGEKRTRCHQYALDRRAAGRRRETIATELAMLRTALNWAENNNVIDVAPPVWVPKHGKTREPLTEDEVMRLFDGAREHHIRLLFLIAFLTGARKSAICELLWSRVDLVRGTIDFRIDDFGDEEGDDILDSSHRKGRAFVDIHPVLLAALAEAKEWARSEYVIEYRGKRVMNPKKGIAEAVRRAGLTGRYIGAHALRHTFATWAADADVDMRKIQRMLGHDDIETTKKVYSKHTRGYVLPAVNAVAKRFTPRPADRSLGKLIDRNKSGADE